MGGNKKRINTMEQLSAEIGVSRATLSKYFQDPSLVRKSTSKKIADLLDTVDYIPNFFARNMNRKQTGLFGVVLPHLNDLFYMTLLREIERRAEELDFSVLIQNSHGDPEKEVRAIKNLRSMNAEGVIVAPIGAEENTPSFKRISSDLPLVFVDAKCPGLEKDFSFVGTDNSQSMKLMVDYLRRSGTPPKYLTMPPVNSNSREREQAYRSRMNEVGLTPEVIRTSSEEPVWDFESHGYEIVRDLLDRGLSKDATILCANDRLAMGALRAANEAGLFNEVNEGALGFRVAGHDDHPLSQYMWPSMTTVSQDVHRIGRAAVDCVSRQARAATETDKLPVDRLFPAQLCIRNSA
ncbi:LacI family DNA-binding transcriptional regulator [Lentilitoribacter sp. EG35]|uniref:LacI family DNA-binding transcriptional regulator n=1 Tax=Lentilitoribacter sp. EG35 TaxID=3234192 RepID=UPI003460EF9A